MDKLEVSNNFPSYPQHPVGIFIYMAFTTIKHGHSRRSGKTAEFRAWQAMKRRCYGKNIERYKDWGGKGVIVCDRWLNSFMNFLVDMGNKPTPKHSLDRFPDTNGNYEPSNCRWATPRQQAGNTTRNHWIEVGGKKMIVRDWARYFGIFESSLRRMINKIGEEKTIIRYKVKYKKSW